MKHFFDFIPLIIFFVLYKTQDIYVATWALIVTTIIHMMVTWIRYNKVDKIQIITTVLVTVFGGLTLFFQDDSFIKWKVTIIYALCAGGLLISQFMGKPLIKSMLGQELTLSNEVWRNINFAWIIFFYVMAIVNIYIAYTLPLDVWVNFKVFGFFFLTLIYIFATGVYIYSHMPKDTVLPKKRKK
ncbi:septation protein A [Candidatus Enterovibrio altilux]|uniref:Inner membrane-spanning protein YciB n=1 Tax=Candidatus Enterovibrio altilux TaxID=1927128 RepID=A0A291B6U6_9GAMM|nr:septation protein A [Candidatus Enterovibrio luxaltus]ATF08721.1 Intracellular septation protein IspA [Candidatus Enterovibrio luxaltus]